MFTKNTGYHIFMAISLILIGFFVFFPLLWMLNTALKPSTEAFTLSFFQTFTLENFKNILSDRQMMNYMKKQSDCLPHQQSFRHICFFISRIQFLKVSLPWA